MRKKICSYLDYSYRKLNYAKIICYRGAVPTGNELHLNFDLNDGCNINCVMCSKKNNYVTQQCISPDIFASNVVEIFATVDDFQCGCMFEPLMYPDFDDAIRLIKQQLKGEIRGSLVCNGTLLDESKRQILIQSGIFKRVRISFDGAYKATFEAIRRGAKYDQVVANVAALVAEKERAACDINIEFNCTIMPQNIEELPDLITLAADLGVNSVTTHKLFPDDYGDVEQGYYNVLVKNMQAASERAAHLKIEFTGQEYRAAEDAVFRQEKLANNLCGYVQKPLVLRLSPDGYIHTPCRQIVGPLGNIFGNSFAEIVDSKKFRFMLDCFHNPNKRICRMCYMFEIPDAVPAVS